MDSTKETQGAFVFLGVIPARLDPLRLARRIEASSRLARLVNTGIQTWIPACAGMTRGKNLDPGSWAGMTKGKMGMTKRRAGMTDRDPSAALRDGSADPVIIVENALKESRKETKRAFVF